jgi:hypothetical protein
MKTTVKTLLLASAVALSLSACASDHHKNGAGKAHCDLKDGKCPVVESLSKANDKLESTIKDAKTLPKDADEAAMKAHLNKISKDVGAVQKELNDTQKAITKAKNSLGKKAPAKAAKKADAAAPAADAKPAAATPAKK